MKKTIIIKTGNTFPEIACQLGDFETWIIKGLGKASSQIKIVDVLKGEPLPPPESCSSVIITGSHAMVTDRLDWSTAIEKWLPTIISSQIPMLGICYGHQLMAAAMGGTVTDHPQGIELGTVTVRIQDAARKDPLFGELGDSFKVHATHSQTVSKLPPGARLLAGNSFEPHHAFKIGKCAWGLQFHPEYDENIMTAYVREMERTHTVSHLDLQKILKQINATPVAAEILRRFSSLS